MPDESPTVSDELPIIKNWRAHEAGVTWSEACEVPLFTDADFVGEIRGPCGPYWFLNTVPSRRGLGAVRPAMVLRCHFVADLSQEYGLVTKTNCYHGGHLFDEIAALTSLVLGVRIRPGGHSREFRRGAADPNGVEDPLGTPCFWSSIPEPVMHVRDPGRPVIPSVVGSRSLADLHALAGIIHLNFDQSIALIRAARFYQDALWLAESEPNLCWLMLVSALESAAGCWAGQKSDNVHRLRDAHPTLFALVSETNDRDFVARVAAVVAPTLKATKKFIDFGIHFLPPAPAIRPAQFAQVDWTPESWIKILTKIYDYRSKALHTGVPFPHPMWSPPFYFEKREPPSEKGTVGLAAHSGGATWISDDLPINLNLFALVVRQMLLAWLKGMQPRS